MPMLTIETYSLIRRYAKEMKENPCIIMFKTENCGACVGVHNLLSQIANRAEFDDIKFYLTYADKDNIADWVNKFMVRSVPSLRSLIGGKPYGSYQGGYFTEKKILEFIQETREAYKEWKAKEELADQKKSK